MNTQVVISDNKIYLKCDFNHGRIARNIAGAKWNKKFSCWQYSKNIFVIREIAEKFGVGGFDASALEFLQSIDMNKLQELKKRTDLPDHPSKIPSWNHQKQAYQFASRLPAAGIFMEMGTGKTKVAIDLMSNAEGVNKILVVCPKRVIGVWEREIPRYAQRPISVLSLDKGTTVRKAEILRASRDTGKASGKGALCVIINYDVIWREPLASDLHDYGFDMIIADEVHRIKTSSGKTSKRMAAFGARIPRRIGLTGTPMPNSPIDIYAIYRFLEPSIFGTNYYKFLEKYANMGGYEGREIIGYKNLDQLRDKIYSIAFRVESRDVLDLPDELHENITFDLNPEAYRTYKELEKTAVATFKETQIITDNVLTQMLRLQQITSGYLPSPDGDVEFGSDKAEAFYDLLSDIDHNEGVVAFYKFKFDAIQIRKQCEKLGRAYYELSGQVDQLATWKVVKGGIIAVQIQSGGEGEDFTKARYAVYYSLTFSMKDYQQSKFRILRPGQSNNVIYYYLEANRTIDKYIIRCLHDKKEVVENVLKHISE